MTDDTQTIITAPLWRPEKVTWVYRNPDPTQVLDRIKSKSARKFLRATDEVMKQYNLSAVYGPCSFEEYLYWLKLYNQRTEEKNFNFIAQPEWYQQKLNEQKIIEKVFIFQGTVLIAGKIITISPDQIARSAFKTSIDFDFPDWSNSSLGLLLDYLYLSYYCALPLKGITAGRSRNLFGLINSLGYLAFKFRVGYSCEILTRDNTFSQEFVAPTNHAFCTFLTPLQGEYCAQPSLYRSSAIMQNDGPWEEIARIYTAPIQPIDTIGTGKK